ncbi:Fic/DOC family protein [Salipaludibacillus aurantiacus]|uniref:protein adenylyltransferase n=1 Tax=Salipaludibacillus aurantiacus TaxID=1601833 RepID=A0A1H9WJB2_9BACI|nr:Fic family protein [Salipaludibacillus aurantiacus]SES33924.1 cell filamentation protein [Salipaludibacillus aurantiacus]
MSKYGTGESAYCYPGTGVLINHFNIREERQLRQMDAVITSKRLTELELQPVSGDFNLEHLKAIHYYIFQDIYSFAGKLRVENISKGGFTFAPAIHLEESSKKLFTRIQNEVWQNHNHEEMAALLAFYLAEINVLHPFRDGNGRSCREFIRTLALHGGFVLDWARANEKTILKASIASTTRLGPLKKVMNQLIYQEVSGSP